MSQTKTGAGQMIKRVLAGSVVGLLVMAAGCAAAAACISRQMLPEGALRYCAWGICALSAFVGCVSAQRRSGRASLPVCMGCALCMLLCMLLLRVAGPEGGAWSWHGAFALCAAALTAAFLRAGRGKRRR